MRRNNLAALIGAAIATGGRNVWPIILPEQEPRRRARSLFRRPKVESGRRVRHTTEAQRAKTEQRYSKRQGDYNTMLANNPCRCGWLA